MYHLIFQANALKTATAQENFAKQNVMELQIYVVSFYPISYRIREAYKNADTIQMDPHSVSQFVSLFPKIWRKNVYLFQQGK